MAKTQALTTTTRNNKIRRLKKHLNKRGSKGTYFFINDKVATEKLRVLEMVK